MTSAKNPSPLASYSEHWIGGDIQAISALAGTMYRYLPEVDDVANSLSRTVAETVHDAGWSGDAADAFTTAWDRDAVGIQGHSAVIARIGDILDELAVNLAGAESDLESAADEARIHGVPIGADGRPPAVADGPYANQQEASAASYATGYAATYQDTMRVAAQARANAATSLADLTQQISPEGKKVNLDGPMNGVTISDYLRGFWGVASAYRKEAEDDVGEARKAARETIREYHERPEARDVGKLQKARAKLTEESENLSRAAAAERKLPGSRLLDYRLNNIFKSLAQEGDDLSVWNKLARFGGEIPVVDIVAAGTGTALSSWDDIQHGMNPAKAITGEAAGNFGGIAAGGLAGNIIYDAIGADSAGAARVVGLSLGATLGGAVAIGVGELVHEGLKENWSQEIGAHGVTGGLVDGSLNVVINSGKDADSLLTAVEHGAEDVGKDIGHGTEHLWDDAIGWL